MTVVRSYEELVAELAASRNNMGISQRKLARATGISQPSVCNALLGTHELRAQRLFALAHALGYDLALVPREDT
jgi:transcriptional regulator with XRE-family HTH domain